MARFRQGSSDILMINIKVGSLKTGNYTIKTKNLTKQYGEQRSVANLSIHVRKDSIHGLLGRNGTGKTTTMKILLGLTKPTLGEAKIFNQDIKNDMKSILPRVGSLIESPGFYPNLTGAENLKIFAHLQGVPNQGTARNVLDLVGLPYNDKKLSSQYSLGMKQHSTIALTLMRDPEVIILDEPINGLDPIGVAETRSFIRDLYDKQDKITLISSHILSGIEQLADDIGIINNGELSEEGSLEELKQKSNGYIHFIVSDTSETASILENDFQISDFQIIDSRQLKIYNTNLSVATINCTFILRDLEVSEARLQEDILGDYFKRVTGGVGIARLGHLRIR